MAAIDVAALANAVIDNYFDRAVKLGFENKVLFDFPRTPYASDMGITEDGYDRPRGILPIEPPTGGKSDKLLILESSSHEAEEFTEYAALGATGADSWITAEPGTISVWEPILTTGFAKDMAGGPTDLVNVIARNMTTAFSKAADKINSLLLGTSARGIIGAIDNAVAYGGVSRTAYTAWQSAVTAVGGNLAIADLEDIEETLESGDRQASEEGYHEYWVPRNQVTNYRRLAGIFGTAELPQSAQSTGGVLDLGHTGYSFGGRPLRVIPGLDSTTWLLPYLGRGRDEIYIKEVRSLQVAVMPYNGDGDLMALSWRGKLIVNRPHLCGKLETVTA